MAINKKLIHFKNKENFDNEVANKNILNSSIVFIQDSKEISTHGAIYKTVNWSVLNVTYNLVVGENGENGIRCFNYILNTYPEGRNYLLETITLTDSETVTINLIYYLTGSPTTYMLLYYANQPDGHNIILHSDGKVSVTII